MSRKPKALTADRFVAEGDFAVTTELYGDPTTPRHLLPGTYCRVLRVFDGIPPRRQAGIVCFNPEATAIAQVRVPESILRVVTLKPGPCDPHIDDMHKRLMLA